jgi:branched-chain amino acid transport system substrate-binding protein
MVHAGVYSSVLHYLKAIEATQSVEAGPVMEAMKSMPTSDPLFGEGEVRSDGRKTHDMYLFRVKSPEQSQGPWDYYELGYTIPAKAAFRPLDQGGCELVQ